jgi:hypothetical protein
MLRPSMLVDWQNQQCEKGQMTKSSLHHQCNTYQNSIDILHRNKKSLFKYKGKCKSHQISKAIMSKISRAGGITIHNIKLYCKVITIKTTWHWHKNRQEDQQNRIEYQA